MSTLEHTYGPTCRLSRMVTFSGSKGDDDIPPLKAQFFYSSPLPIDDPLTAVPTPSGSESRPTKHAPRPFSAHDNIALEEAWLGLGSDQDRKNHRKLKNSSLRPLTRTQAERRALVSSEPATKQSKDKAKDAMNKKSVKENDDNKATKTICTVCPSTDGKLDKEPDYPAKVSKGIMKSTGAIADSGHINLLGPASATDGPTVGSSQKNAKESTTTIPKIPYDADAENAQSKEAASGNPFNSKPEDPPHTPMDASQFLCCSELEHDISAEQQEDTRDWLKTEEGARGVHQDVRAKADKQKGKSFFKAEKGPNSAMKPEKKQDEGPGQNDSTNDLSQHLKDDGDIASGLAPEKELEDPKLKEGESNEQKASEKIKHFRDHKLFKEYRKADPATLSKTLYVSAGFNKNKLTVSGASETGTTGFPFQRAPSRRGNFSSKSRSPSPSIHEDIRKQPEAYNILDNDPEPSNVQSLNVAETVHVHHCKARKSGHNDTNIPVGISRLHLVKLPDLLMMPIYWSPVHDIAVVTRGTWFYKDTMHPVEPTVANQLEIGYRELRPWSQTWVDELRSALEVGAAGEEKITHRIWPKEIDQTKSSTSNNQILTAADPFCAARCFHGEVAAVGNIEIGDTDAKSAGPTQIMKRFPNSQVIYQDSQHAFILKPSLQPSEYYGRRPLAKIKKGLTVGIPVVRGFDWKTWEKVHEPKKSLKAVKAEEGAPVAGDAAAGKRTACAACLEQEKKMTVTDLILVIHGIGQKLSERVESFHFTHAINSFRRSINVEVGTAAVQKVCRDDLGGVMILPVNWRSNLSFEDGGPAKKGDLHKDRAVPDFTLKDITPDTIPAVRNLVSDVMLDIPFYMSDHKPKMIEALVGEANRVYRLWCQNNPEFQRAGRVHIIAHSLGSAMAMDVLSKQPTSINHVDLRTKKTSTKHFEFDTKNLFFVGSPAGFFLLLNNGKLVPRRGRNKPDAEPGDDKEKEIAGEAGTFGCLAIDNLYNVMHCNDPVAYRLNATVDPLYSATLKNAQVPSATTGWIEAIGNAVRSITPGIAKTPELGVGQIVKPTVSRLPSQLEMEVHDFTREEIAEKKFFLLNDNGQIDYFLSSGGGPLEIQYFNMLSAHSSYWGSADFTRMVVTEVGREPGRTHCLPNMKALKASHK